MFGMDLNRACIATLRPSECWISRNGRSILATLSTLMKERFVSMDRLMTEKLTIMKSRMFQESYR